MKILKYLLLFLDLIFFFFQRRNFKAIRNVDFLFLQHRVNYSYFHEGKIYAPLLYSVYYFLTKLQKTRVAFLNKPFSKIKKQHSYYESISTDSYFLFESLSNFLVKKILGEIKAKEIRDFRRFYIWNKILRLINPKIIIAILPETQLCRAAKKEKIRVYELQHGVISKSHKWYGQDMPNIISDEELPHGFLFWDNASAESISFWTEKRGVESHIIGHVWVNRFRNIDNTDKVINQAILALDYIDRKKPVILISLQWGLNRYYPDASFNNIMCEALEKVILQTATQYQWLLRLHPVQMQSKNSKKTLKYLQDKFGKLPNIEWENSSKVALPALLTKVDLHITDMSTTVTEAMWFNIPSAILNPLVNEGEKLQYLFEYERRLKIAKIVEQDEESIILWIRESLRNNEVDGLVNTLEPNLNFLLNYINIQ